MTLFLWPESFLLDRVANDIIPFISEHIENRVMPLQMLMWSNAAKSKRDL